ncbi:hypothetical protein [Nonomuraea sp. 10N515B]|uniref:hypothetical protein n=1 Tax=Nonomuraea sp. 10N515B TaxID=3457422 RepID=UPI003FCC3B70
MRRKFVGPPVVVGALALAVLAFFLVPVRYSANASLVLVAPPSGGTLSFDPTKPEGLTNPLLQYNDSMRTVVGILVLTMSSPTVQQELGVEEGSPQQIVVDDGRSNADLLGIVTAGPFVHIKGEGPTEAAVRDLMSRTEKRLRQELLDQQRVLGAPTSTFIAINVIATLEPKADVSNKLQAAGAALILGLGIGLGVAYVVTRRLAGRKVPTETASSSPAEPPEDTGARVNGKVLVFAGDKDGEHVQDYAREIDDTAPVPRWVDPDDESDKS